MPDGCGGVLRCFFNLKLTTQPSKLPKNKACNLRPA
jgi:hypothetical protein